MRHLFTPLSASVSTSLHQLSACCLLCGHRAQANIDLCRLCATRLPRAGYQCNRCAIPMATDQPHCGECLKTPPAFHRTLAPFSYTFPIDTLILRFKHQHHFASGRTLGLLLLEHVRQHYPSDALPDLLVATPLHRRRLFQRGFNQSAQLSQTLSKGLGIPESKHLLTRTHYQESQQRLGRRKRRQNLKGQFTSTTECQSQRIAVIDDVMTTGSTANEISHTLLSQGAREVHIWCLARVAMD